MNEMINYGSYCPRFRIAVDFDSTLTEYEGYPGLDAPLRKNAKEALNRLAKHACILIWTCRDGEMGKEACKWLREQGVIFMHFNENCSIAECKYGYARKIGADIYIDDKSLFSPKDLDWLEIENLCMARIQKFYHPETTIQTTLQAVFA